MTKQAVIDAVADALPPTATREDARRAVDAVIGAVGAGLRDEGRFMLSGLGTFTLRERPAREGRNPATGEAIDIPARTAVRFKPAPALDEAAGAGPRA